MRRFLLPGLTAVFLAATPLLAQAQTGAQTGGQTATIERTGQADDEVMLRLEVEGWVETKTANLVVAIDMALQGGQMADARDQVNGTLNALVEGVEWRTTHFNRQMDAAGLERWQVIAEARVAEAKLAGVQDKAKATSKPGLNIRVAGIDFTPTLAERKSVESTLRAQIYDQAKAELDRLNKAFPERGYRLRMIDFQSSDQQPMARPQLMMSKSETSSMQAADSAGGDGFAVSRRMVVGATVVLGAVAPGAGKTP